MPNKKMGFITLLIVISTISLLFVIKTFAQNISDDHLNNDTFEEMDYEHPDDGYELNEEPTAYDVERGEKWKLAIGGRIYDKWWEVMGVGQPENFNKKYPIKLSKEQISESWRCVSCHGWDYEGNKKLNMPGIKTVRDRNINDIITILRSPSHNYTQDMIPNMELEYLALFISKGLYDLEEFFDKNQKAIGIAMRGRDIFQGVCANCHQPDGKAYIQSEIGDKSSLGWLANHKPAQALHKIYNGQPGSDMLSLRFMGKEDVADLMAYIQELDH